MPLLTALHRHDRVLVVAIVAGVVLASWAYLLLGAEMPMPEMPGMDMPMAKPVWTAGYAALMLLMWLAMMTAMMLPSAVPMLLFYDSIARKRGAEASTIGPTSLFGLGYLVIWAGFSIAAVLLQYGFDRVALLSPMMQTTSTALAGIILVGPASTNGHRSSRRVCGSADRRSIS
jgi:predicted metal-binding membrane protein